MKTVWRTLRRLLSPPAWLSRFLRSSPLRLIKGRLPGGARFTIQRGDPAPFHPPAGIPPEIVKAALETASAAREQFENGRTFSALSTLADAGVEARLLVEEITPGATRECLVTVRAPSEEAEGR